MPLAPSAHADSFARDNLPPEEEWPEFLFDLPELKYPENLNIAARLIDDAVAEGLGDKSVILTAERAWSYGELQATANRIANFLVIEMGLETGNRVLLASPNTPWMAACWLAVMKAGGIAVSTMPLLRAKELTFIIDKAKISHALYDQRLIEPLRAADESTHLIRAAHAFGPGSDFNACLDDMSDGFETVATSRDDVALLAFTSGTTGEPKATMHFHRDLCAMVDCFPRSTLKAKPADIFIGTPPLAFTFGLGGLLAFPLAARAATVLDEVASPAALKEAIATHRATICFTAPTAYRVMLHSEDLHDISSLRECVSAGETLPAATFEAWHDRTGIKLIDGLGSTELTHIFISAAGDGIRPGATGKPIPGYKAQVIDEAGQPLPAGTVGRLAVKGPTGCRYLADPRQREYVQDGWNLTGDAYLIDEDGYFWFQARTDDMILSGGYNIAGPEVEAVLLEHPAVGECAVVGAPDEDRGHIVKAFVVLANDAAPGAELDAELKAFVKQRIAPYKYPREIDFVTSLPKTETGKIQRYKLRAAE